jgi:hypothetical protein
MLVKPRQLCHDHFLEMVVIEQPYYKFKSHNLVSMIEQARRYVIHSLSVAG